jgi:hypothetical protein
MAAFAISGKDNITNSIWEYDSYTDDVVRIVRT